MPVRRRQHIKSALSGSDGCCVFYRAIRRYGPDAFEWRVVLVASSRRVLDHMESEYIEEFKTLNPSGYNLKGGGACSVYSIASRKKMSDSQKKRSPEIQRRMNEMSVRVRATPEYRKKASDAARLSMSRASVKQNMSKSAKESQNRAEVKKKKSDLAKQNWADPAYRIRNSKASKAARKSPEARKRNSDAQKRRPPEVQARMTASIAAAMQRDDVRAKLRAAVIGKSYEEIMGPDVAAAKKKKISDGVRAACARKRAEKSSA